MKIFLFLLLLSSSSIYANDISQNAKTIIYNEISDMVFFEDEGAVRAPTDLADFNFVQENDSTILVKGTSYSEWDMKDIEYECRVTLLSNGLIQSNKDISVDCNIKNENWPHF
jgi:hypothetical protein